jgi:hypothetical protein
MDTSLLKFKAYKLYRHFFREVEAHLVATPI